MHALAGDYYSCVFCAALPPTPPNPKKTVQDWISLKQVLLAYISFAQWKPYTSSFLHALSRKMYFIVFGSVVSDLWISNDASESCAFWFPLCFLSTQNEAVYPRFGQPMSALFGAHVADTQFS